MGKSSFRKCYYVFDVRSCPVFVQIPTSPPFNILEAENLDCGLPMIFSPVKLFESLGLWSFFPPAINSSDFSMEDNPFNVACTPRCYMYFMLWIKERIPIRVFHFANSDNVFKFITVSFRLLSWNLNSEIFHLCVLGFSKRFP